MSTGAPEAGEQHVRDAVRRHARTRTFTEAEDVISAVLSDPGVQEARRWAEAAEAEMGTELSARVQPFQDRYDRAVAGGDADGLAGLCAGKHGRWGRICVLRDLNGGAALGPHLRGPADRVGGQRAA
ncbi:hypothetical protein [Streptomyces albidoflavus]|uniref:hypothetical protein n=1 Tax=Streptomyces albidoflavus TaxID=1886 RepID=UPI0033E744E5